MKEYELLCEYYDTCSLKPTTSLKEIETDNLDEYMRQFIPQNAACTGTTTPEGDIVYDIMHAGIRKRYQFTEL